MSAQNIWQFVITARHLLENLASDLYSNAADCLWEIVRNGLCACMPNGVWNPSAATVEVSLVDNHPLAPKVKSLVILDHGSGFTEGAIKLYCTIGAAIGDSANGHSGAAQKRIGRFAAFALNKLCLEDGDVSTGFYILTRTQSDGPVTMVAMIPERIEQNKGMVVVNQISHNASELGSLKGFRGSFTAIIIPHSVYTSLDEIREALQWRIPRKKSLMFNLLVGDRPMVPPPLASRMNDVPQQAGIEVHLDRLKDGEDTDGGIWFTDLTTGIRVANATVLGSRNLPYPLWRNELTGDIFVPNLLANQDTARSTLSRKYLASNAWKKHALYLGAHVSPKAQELIGNSDVLGRDPVSQAVKDVVDLFTKTWGAPKVPQTGPGGVWDFIDPKRQIERRGSRGSYGPRGSNGTGDGGKTKPVKSRIVPISIGKDVYYLNSREMEEWVLAEVNTTSAGSRIIWVNNRKYVAMPSTKEARGEHVILKILEAAGRAIYTDSPAAVSKYVAEKRAELLRSRR